MSMIPISPIDIYEGNNVTFYTSASPKVGSAAGAFLTVTGEPVDPDIVEFSYIVQGMEPNVFTYTQPSHHSNRQPSGSLDLALGRIPDTRRHLKHLRSCSRGHYKCSRK